MVQRKVSNKVGIRGDHVKSDKQQLLSLRPSSPQAHDLKKKMKKSRPVKENLRSSPPLRKEKTQPGKPPPLVQEPLHFQAKNGAAAAAAAAAAGATPQKQSPNYMKSTSSSEARKDRLSSVSSRVSTIVNKAASSKNSDKPKIHSSGSGHKASKTSTARTSSLKLVRSLTKTTSFKPSRPSKKCSPVVLCEDLDAQRATCSSTLKDSKFPNYLELSPGGTESEGTSVMKVCPFTYCSLNGHHHNPSPPLRCFLSARRRALKTQKSFKLGCLSPRHTKPVEKQNKDISNELVMFSEEAPAEEVDVKGSPTPPYMEEENPDFFIEIYSKDCAGNQERDSERSEMNWEEGCLSASGLEDTTIKSLETDGEIVPEAETLKSSEERLYEKLQGLYDEESVSSGAWLEEEDGDSDSDDSCQQMESNHEGYELSPKCDDAFEVSPTTSETDVNNEMDGIQENESMVDTIESVFEEPKATCGDMDAVSEAEDELQHLDRPMGDHDIKCNISYERKETPQVKPSELPGNPGHDRDGTDKHHTTIYNFIQVHISIFVNQKGTEDSRADQGVPVQPHTAADATCKMEIKEIDAAKFMAGAKPFELLQGLNDVEQDMTTEGNDEGQLTSIDEASQMNQMFADEEASVGKKDDTSNEQSDGNDDENQEGPEEQCNKSEAYNRLNSMGSEDHNTSDNVELRGTEHIKHAVNEMDLDCACKSDEEVTNISGNSPSGTETNNLYLHKAKTSNEEQPEPSKTLRRSTGKKPDQDLEGLRDFNPRGPNFLPLVPDPDAETVDLRHQTMDERKNAEEWMVDFALQQAVTKLAPARKKKVALLVEAFEKVIPTPKYETHIKRPSEAFAHARPMQACN